MTQTNQPSTAVTDDDLRALLAAIDVTLRGGGYRPGANTAFRLLCHHLGVDRNALEFDPAWLDDAGEIGVRAGAIAVNQPYQPATGQVHATAGATADGSKGATGGGTIEVDANGLPS